MTGTGTQTNTRPNAARRLTGLLILALALLFPSGLAAQEIDIFPNARELTTDDAFVLTIKISGYKGGHMPRWPSIRGMQSAGSRTAQNWINGHLTIEFSKTYYAPKPGNYEVPALSYTVNGKKKTLPAFTLKVKKGTGKRQQAQRSNPFDNFFRNPFGDDDFFRDPFDRRSGGKKKDLKFEETQADYFLSVNLNKETAYVGEQIRGEVVLYINERDRGKVAVDGTAIVEMQQRIRNTGFWQEIFDFKQIPQERVTINGQRYLAFTLYRTILFPIRTGTIAFDDVYLDAKKLFVATNASPFEAFLGRNTRYEPIKIRANQRQLKVLPLPETDLPNASMVGKFRMEAGLNTARLNTGENLELTVNIRGNGNIAMMPNPSIDFPDAFNFDEPTTEFNTRKDQNAYYGEKSFKYYLVPTRSGEYDLGPVRFYFFDPQTKQYDSLVVDRVPVKVTGEDLDNLVLKKSGLDRFYESALKDAGQRPKRDGPINQWLFLGIVVAMGGAIAAGAVMRGRKAPEPPEKDDFWS